MNRYLRRAIRLAPIRFSTSNIPKFLQARLILQSNGFDVELLEAHREPYVEPYGLPKRAFLKAGLEQVISRAGATGIVFIEDTTVSIPALGRGADYPGQATKEWFAETGHDELLSALNAAGGDKRVAVSSDIALYVPGLFPDFPIFSGTTLGVVVDTVPEVRHNPLYPWLGRQDFSSWFVPEGAKTVLAALELEESLRYDFRVKSLKQLSERLEEYASILNLPAASTRHASMSARRNPAQLTIFPQDANDIVLVVIGSTAAGKTSLGHYLALHRGFYHIEGSTALAAAATALGRSASDYASMFDLADALFETAGDDIVEAKVVAPILDEIYSPIVYTGCRTLEGVATVMRASHELGRPFAILNVSSRSSVRLLRAKARSRDNLQVEPLTFDEMSRRDDAYGAAAFGKLICDAHLVNHSDITAFLNNIDQTVATLRAGRRRQSTARRYLNSKIARAENPDDIGGILQRLGPGLVALRDDQLSLTRRAEALLALLKRDNKG